MTTRFGLALTAIAENLRFFTRLPIGVSAHAPDFAAIAWAAPLAGGVVGAIGGAIFFGCRELGFSAMISATLALAGEIGVSGGLHEDGLADVADGFGGGRDRDAKLAIMRDSRIGTYGALALLLILLLRVEAIGALARYGAAFAVAALMLSAAAARAAALSPLAWAPPARADGVGAGVGGLSASALRAVAATQVLLAAALGVFSLELVRAFFACVIGAVAARGFVGLAQRQIGGQTGDVCGATAAIVEVVVLLGLLIGGRDA